MFRSDRDALAQEVEDLRHEKARLDAENEAMRADLLTRRLETPPRIGGNVYKTGIAGLGPGERAAFSRHRLKELPVWAGLLAHFATFGLFSLVQMGLHHERLPQVERDDPSAFKSIGLTFVPYFNLYWIIFSTMRLTDRINLQYRLRGLPDAVPRSFLMVASIVGVIPYVNAVFGVLLFWPIAMLYLQLAVNRLARLAREEAESRVDAAAVAVAGAAWSPEVPWKARIEPSGEGPRDVGREFEAEAEAEAVGEGVEAARERRFR